MGKGNCITCHNGPNLTDNLFHNLAVPDDHVRSDPQVLASIQFDAKRTEYKDWAGLEEDPGRAQITHDSADFGAFRTMGLRNVEDSPPYMHNGALATLEDVVRFYNEGGGEHPSKTGLMQPLGLDDLEIEDLVVFLREAFQDTRQQTEFSEQSRCHILRPKHGYAVSEALSRLPHAAHIGILSCTRSHLRASRQGRFLPVQ